MVFYGFVDFFSIIFNKLALSDSRVWIYTVLPVSVNFLTDDMMVCASWKIEYILELILLFLSVLNESGCSLNVTKLNDALTHEESPLFAEVVWNMSIFVCEICYRAILHRGRPWFSLPEFHLSVCNFLHHDKLSVDDFTFKFHQLCQMKVSLIIPLLKFLEK